MDFLITNFAEILFYCLAALTVAGGIGVLVFKSPVHAALSLLFTFVMVAALFLLLYSGACMLILAPEIRRGLFDRWSGKVDGDSV